MDLSGYIHVDGKHNTTNPVYEYDALTDTILGSSLIVLAIVGISFNLIALCAVRVVTKRNCSKARLASSLFIFNLSLSDTIYSMIHIFSAVTMLLGGREKGIGHNIFTAILCNFTGVLFNLTIRSSLLFLTMLTAVRYMAVIFPLKLPNLITKKRVKIVAVAIWSFVFILSLIPYSINVGYHYSKPLSICIWTVDEMVDEKTDDRTAGSVLRAKLWIHVTLMIMPIVLPGIIIISLYLQIVLKVIQLKAVHHKLRSGNIAKGTLQKHKLLSNTSVVTEMGHETDPVMVGQSPSHMALRKKLSSFSISSGMSFLRRPLSLIELEKYERETENIDQDLMDFAVSSLHKSTFTSGVPDKKGVVAYYVNRFIVKTAGNATFERIQSNSFMDTKRSEDYTGEECPISLNYYDCQENAEPANSRFALRRPSASPSVCDETAAPDEVHVRNFRINNRQQTVRPCSGPDSECSDIHAASGTARKQSMSEVVEQAMKKMLNKSMGDVRSMPIASPATDRLATDEVDDHCSELSSIRGTSNIFKQVAARCRTNSIVEETLDVSVQLAEPVNIQTEPVNTRTDSVNKQTEPVKKRTESVKERTESVKIRTGPVNKKKVILSHSESEPKVVCVNGVCSEVKTNKNDTFKPGFRINTNPRPIVNNRHRVVNKAASLPGKLAVVEENSEKFTVVQKSARFGSSPEVFDNGEVIQAKKQSFKGKIFTQMSITKKKSQKNFTMQAKRIKRLDMRLNIIIQSAFYTLLMITLFVICYMLWWVLSIDILNRYLKQRALIDVSFTAYCNLLTTSYCTILLNACFNPIIYFYFAYKQAMLDTLKLKYQQYKRAKRARGSMRPRPKKAPISNNVATKASNMTTIIATVTGRG